MKFITRTVWVLSFVSLFTDIASEMLYPIMPVYLRSIGFSIVLIGILEGLAEAVAGLSKGYFGELSDNSGKRLPFVRFGYLLSAISKPMMIVFVYPVWIFFARSLDRFGKGLRTAARDAMLSDEATKETKGKVFGFHRSMDTLGAVLGPCVALMYLYFFPGEYKMLFLIAFVPGVLAITFTYFLKDKIVPAKSKHTSFLSFITYLKNSPLSYRKLIAGLLVFTLFNSSDVFLLLKVKEAGGDDAHVIGVYIFYNLIYALFAYPIGIVADRIGLKRMFIIGLVLFAIAYAAMSMATIPLHFFIIFFLYGVYSASTEGVSKAWITNMVAKENTATAIGTYAAFNSICSLLASTLAGFIWYQYGAGTTFLTSAAITLCVAFYLSTLSAEETNN